MSLSRKMVVAIYGEAKLAASIGNSLIGRNGFCYEEGKSNDHVASGLEGEFKIKQKESRANFSLFVEQKEMPAVSTYCVMLGSKMQNHQALGFMRTMCDEVSTLIYIIDLSRDQPSQLKKLNDFIKTVGFDQHNLSSSGFSPAVMLVGLQTSDVSLIFSKDILNVSIV